MREASFDLEDLLEQFRQVSKMGSASQLLDLLPRMGRSDRELSAQAADRQFKRFEAIILSMTPEERRRPRIVDGSRKKRIARGSGTTVQEVNALLGQFRQIQRMMKQVGKREGRGLMAMLR